MGRRKLIYLPRSGGKKISLSLLHLVPVTNDGEHRVLFLKKPNGPLFASEVKV